jgi:hypothetical protein
MGLQLIALGMPDYSAVSTSSILIQKCWGDSHEMSQPADAGLTQMGVAPIHGAVSGCPISLI